MHITSLMISVWDRNLCAFGSYLGTMRSLTPECARVCKVKEVREERYGRKSIDAGRFQDQIIQTVPMGWVRHRVVTPIFRST